jgi:biopolymer transport protein ExbB
MLNLAQLRRTWPVLLLVLLMTAAMALAATDATPPDKGGKEPDEKRTTLGDLIRAGGIVGHTIIFLSFVGLALVIDSFMRIQAKKLVPPLLAEQLTQMARQGKYAELQNLCHSIDCMLSRIVTSTFAQGRMSWAAAREVMQEQGTMEVTRLYHRVGYIGFIASVAPMLGLLGTVTGMIKSFNVLGTAKGAARAEDLAIGVAEALVTTLEGLIVAVPLMFAHTYLKDRVTRIGQEAASVCDRLMRAMTEGQPARPQPQAAAQEAPQESQEP